MSAGRRFFQLVRFYRNGKKTKSIVQKYICIHCADGVFQDERPTSFKNPVRLLAVTSYRRYHSLHDKRYWNDPYWIVVRNWCLRIGKRRKSNGSVRATIVAETSARGYNLLLLFARARTESTRASCRRNITTRVHT